MHISFVTVPILLCTMYNLFLSAGVVVRTATGRREEREKGDARAMMNKEKREERRDATFERCDG